MILANFISILEYGAKIFLAVMGFISFDDINEKPVYNSFQKHQFVENINFVESLKAEELGHSEKTYYAHPTYFFRECEPKNLSLANIDDFTITNEVFALNSQADKILDESENYFKIEEKEFNDFEILVFLEHEKSEIETLIKVVEGKNISSRAAQSVKFLTISNSTTIN